MVYNQLTVGYCQAKPEFRAMYVLTITGCFLWEGMPPSVFQGQLTSASVNDIMPRSHADTCSSSSIIGAKDDKARPVAHALFDADV